MTKKAKSQSNKTVKLAEVEVSSSLVKELIVQHAKDLKEKQRRQAAELKAKEFKDRKKNLFNEFKKDKDRIRWVALKKIIQKGKSIKQTLSLTFSVETYKIDFNPKIKKIDYDHSIDKIPESPNLFKEEVREMNTLVDKLYKKGYRKIIREYGMEKNYHWNYMN